MLIAFCFFSTLILLAQVEKQTKVYTVKKQKEEIIIYENYDMVFSYKSSASVEIPDSLKTLLPAIVKYLKKNPKSIIRIIGHSDDMGTFEENQQRSTERAERVASFLKSKGINELRIMANGKGSTEPFASNKTEAGRLKNRRVELRIIPSVKEFEKK